MDNISKAVNIIVLPARKKDVFSISDEGNIVDCKDVVVRVGYSSAHGQNLGIFSIRLVILNGGIYCRQTNIVVSKNVGFPLGLNKRTMDTSLITIVTIYGVSYIKDGNYL